MGAACRRRRGFRPPLWPEVGRGGAWAASVFFSEAVIGEHLGDESGADGEVQLGQRVSDLIHIAIGFEAHADDERLELLGAFGWGVGTRPFGQEVGRRPLEDGVADVVVGFARFEAEASGELAFGEAAEFPEGDHADLLLDSLFLGEGDGLPGRVRQHERAVFDLNVDIESDMHGHLLPRGGGGPECCRYVYVIYAQSQEPSTAAHGPTSSAGFMFINVGTVES